MIQRIFLSFKRNTKVIHGGDFMLGALFAITIFIYLFEFLFTDGNIQAIGIFVLIFAIGMIFVNIFFYLGGIIDIV